jgi:L-malate glycosyltransferase
MSLYTLITFKRWIEQVIMYPFILAGRVWASKHPLKEEYDLFCFFPFYVLGGAEKVNAEILGCFPDKKIIVFFTKLSANDKMLHLFRLPNVTLKDISKHTDNKRLYWMSFFCRGVCSAYINKQKKQPVVFNGQCNFAYKLFPHVKKSIRKVELIHNSYKPFAWITFPYIPFIDTRVMIAESLIKDHKRFYDEIGVNPLYKNRISKILNKIGKPVNAAPRSNYGDRIKVCYAGRGGHQKRVWLIDRIVTECIRQNLPLDFHFAGNFKDELSDFVLQHATYHGEIEGGEPMIQFLQKMDVLLMTSAFEGFPMVIMEAMINGVVPIVTAVDGVLEHVHHQQNGLLINDPADENKVVNQAILLLKHICDHHDQLSNMSKSAFDYADKTFSPESFCNNYRAVLFNEK